MLVRYFAGAAAAAGCEQEGVELAAGSTVSDLRRLLEARHRGLRPVLEISSLLVDGAAGDDSTSLDGVAGVDVLPPFAGG